MNCSIKVFYYDLSTCQIIEAGNKPENFLWGKETICIFAEKNIKAVPKGYMFI